MHNKTSPEEWLKHEDEACYPERLSRLNWLTDASQGLGDLFLLGGTVSHYLFEEARYCFVYGQFLATVVLGMAFISQELAAKFYTAGRNDLERADASTLIEEAFQQHLISEKDYEVLQKIRRFRNPLEHFRKPLHRESIERRAVNQDEHPYTIIEEDAKTVLAAIFRLLKLGALSF